MGRKVCQGVAAPSETVFPCSAVPPLRGFGLRNGKVPYTGVSADDVGPDFFLVSDFSSGVVSCRFGGRAYDALHAGNQCPGRGPPFGASLGVTVLFPGAECTLGSARTAGSLFRESVVPRHIWISSVKLPEFPQAAYRKVVEQFFHPVLAFRIVEPFDEVEDSFVITSAALDRGHNFIHVLFFRMLNIIGFL